MKEIKHQTNYFQTVKPGLSTLSEDSLIFQAKELVQTERKTTLMVLDYLCEIERRGIPALRGYGSTHDFAVQVLGYSSGAAHRRIQSMRAMRDVPEIRRGLESGALNLTQVALVQGTFRREVLKTQKSDRPKLVARKKEILLQAQSSHESTRVTEQKLKTEFPESTYLHESRRPVNGTQTEVRVVLDSTSIQNLEELKLRLSHQVRGFTDSETMKHALELALECLDLKLKTTQQTQFKKEVENKISTVWHSPRSEAETETTLISESTFLKSASCAITPKNPKSRAIPKAWREFLFQNSEPSLLRSPVQEPHLYTQGAHLQKPCCQYVDPRTQKRCDSRFQLQIDHILPLSSLKGRTEIGNLRVLCGVHNRSRSLLR